MLSEKCRTTAPGAELPLKFGEVWPPLTMFYHDWPNEAKLCQMLTKFDNHRLMLAESGPMWTQSYQSWRSWPSG